MDYKQILEVCGKATEGPWEATAVSGEWGIDENAIISMDLKMPVKNMSVRQSRNDAYFITIARTAMPELLERCMALEKVTEAAEHLKNGIIAQEITSGSKDFGVDERLGRLIGALDALKDGE